MVLATDRNCVSETITLDVRPQRYRNRNEKEMAKVKIPARYTGTLPTVLGRKEDELRSLKSEAAELIERGLRLHRQKNKKKRKRNENEQS